MEYCCRWGLNAYPELQLGFVYEFEVENFCLAFSSRWNCCLWLHEANCFNVKPHLQQYFCFYSLFISSSMRKVKFVLDYCCYNQNLGHFR